MSNDGDNAAAAGFVQGGVEPLVVDARGHRCPVPHPAPAQSRWSETAEGQVECLRLLADDPLAGIDVPHFVQTEGFRLLSSTRDGRTLIFEVVGQG